MSLNNFIPQLWADTLLPALRANLVYGNLFNEDYQGQISQMGDTVKINSIGDVSIFNYTKDTDLNAPQALTDAQSMLTISQAKYYNFEVDDVDQAQAHPQVMTEAMSWAAFELANTMDLYYAGFYTDAVNNIGSTSSWQTVTVPTNTNVGGGTTLYDYLVMMNQKLTENKVPKQGRWCVIPPWGTTFLIQDIRFTSFNTADARMTIQTNKIDAAGGSTGDAYIGRVAGMDVYESINAPHLSAASNVGVTGAQDVFLAGHTMTLTKATGINKVEAYRPPYRFADAVKGLALYGAKTIRPYALCAGYFQHP
jgi:hypothetical protein